MSDSLLSSLLTPQNVGIAIVSLVGLVVLKKVLGGRKNAAPSGPLLHAKEYRDFELIEKKELTTGVNNPVTLFRFGLPVGQSLGLPTGQHISLRCTIDGEEVVRYYTPTTSNRVKGYFDLVVKVYPDGKMSQHLNLLPIGGKIQISGPKGVHIYQRNQNKHLGLIAGGTGITPCYQVIQEILEDPEDNTKVSLLYGNLTEDDIIIRDLIDEYAEKYPEQFTVYHVLNHPPDDWKHGAGFITKDMMKQFFAEPSENVKIGMCGPPVMCKVMRAHLQELGYKKDQVYSY